MVVTMLGITSLETRDTTLRAASHVHQGMCMQATRAGVVTAMQPKSVVEVWCCQGVTASSYMP